MSELNKDSGRLFGRPTWLLAVVVAAIFVLVAIVLAATKNTNTPASTISPAATADMGVIQELGIKVTWPAALKDIKRASASTAGSADSNQTVSLSTDKYAALVNKCLGLPAKTTENFATLYRGLLVTGITPPANSMKTFDTFYIGNLGSTNINPVCKDQNTQKELNDLSSSLNAALTQTLSGAVKL